MKKQIAALSVAAAAMMSFAGPAAATCVFGCGPAPAPVAPKLDFSVSTTGITSGLAGSQAMGNITMTMASESGMTDSFVNLGGFGNLCGANCANGSWSANTMAYHQASTSGLALSGGLGGSTAQVLGQTQTGAGANLFIEKK